jgi:hypothetical protein
VNLDGREVLAGALYSHRRRGTESATFAYVTECLSAAGAHALDPELPLSSGARQTRVRRALTLFGASTDCAGPLWPHPDRPPGGRPEAALARISGTTFSGTLVFHSYDHFGLDADDEITQYGFVDWFTLQHDDRFDGTYVPPVAVPDVEVPIRGSFSPGGCRIVPFTARVPVVNPHGWVVRDQAVTIEHAVTIERADGDGTIAAPADVARYVTWTHQLRNITP